MSKRDRLRDSLYHLGKALWKSVPIVGPIVEELVYEQFKTELLGKVEQSVAGLSEAQLDELLAQLPTQERLASLEENLEGIGWERGLAAANQHANLLQAMTEGFSSVNSQFSQIQGLLMEMGDTLASGDLLREKLHAAEQRRIQWIGRISVSQVNLLELVPHEPTEANTLWQRARQVIADCSHLEFRFRMHELEWLGLVDRKKRPGGEGDWLYWRVLEGRPPPT